MYINFINKKIQKMCENHTVAIKKLGPRNADLLFQRVSEIRAADSLSVFKMLPGPRCHLLHNERHGQYAVDLVHPKRLLLLPTTDQGEIIEKLTTEVTIIEITDYH